MTELHTQLLAERVRNEYRAMPGLSLTVSQAVRLWGVDSASTRRLLESLVAQRFLRETHVGTFVRQ
jgi:DNA-binding IclR family transcriptional regulator